MLTEAATMIRQAHENGLISVTWIYPRGQAVLDEKDPQLISGAAGVAVCIGADFTKVNYPDAYEGMTRPESLGVAVEAAGRTGIICSGGGSLPPRDFLQRLHEQINISGARGAATGRNIHQKTTDEGVRMAAACHAIICEGASVDDPDGQLDPSDTAEIGVIIHNLGGSSIEAPQAIFSTSDSSATFATLYVPTTLL